MRRAGAETLVPLNKVLMSTFDQIEELSRLKGRLSGVPTGLYDLDRMLTGLHGGELVLLLEHMLLSHHGEAEYGSPRKPMFPEAEVLHWVDLLDARMNEMSSAIAKVKPGVFSDKIWSLDRRLYHADYDALTPGGLFVFDINTPAKLRGLDGQVFLDETDDTYCVWRTEFDEKKCLCYYDMDIFRLEGEHWQRSFEEHIEYAYEPAELQQWLAEAGFTRIRSYGDRVLRAPKEAEQRIYFSAKKE